MKNTISRSLAAVYIHTDTSSKIKNLVNNKIKINKIYSKNYASNRTKIAGITLIALVITVIILIILAGITIGTLKNFSLFDKAKKAKKDYTNSQKQEENRLNEYEIQISEAEGNVNIYKGKTWNFDYTGGEQTFEVPINGIYKLETWGAQGGSYTSDYIGGYGGYSEGYITLDINKKIYIYVGGAGQNYQEEAFSYGGFNGGGLGGANPQDNRSYHQGGSGGGGATHVALKKGILNELENSKESILIVAGGRRWFWIL